MGPKRERNFDLHQVPTSLVYYHEKSLEDVARIIGTPENTVKTRVFYARRRMGNLLKAAGLESSRTGA